jgi:formate hydrogenlyase transcriptional activator
MLNSELIGSSAKFRAVLDEINMVAPADCAVLIQGETGTGKEVVAQAIHNASPRRGNRFVAVNCAAIPSALLESQLFGHERGAFTGAVTQTTGRFQAADHGTLFLDEIGDLPLELQPKLLRVLQEKEIERVGGGRSFPVDVRVVAATNQDLWRMVQDKKFRADLFHRLNVFPIALPPLRERKADIPLLVHYFVGRYAARAGKEIERVDQSTLEAFQEYNWPGNIRELQNVVERAVVLTDTDTLFVDEKWLPRMAATSSKPRDGLSALAEQEAEIIEAALAESRGRVSGPSGAATKLRMRRQTLESKIQRLGINKNAFVVESPGSMRTLRMAAASA